jgi:hypothetical protein
MRIYAMDSLAEADATRCSRDLQRHLPMWEGETLAHACAMAVELKDTKLIGALTRSLERGIEGGKVQRRPEWNALEQLGGRPVAETLEVQVEQPGDRATRQAALDLLASIVGEDQLKARLQRDDAPDAWLADLKWWVGAFGAAPRGDMEMRWVQYLHQPRQAAMVARALERHRQLVGSGSRGEGAADYQAAPRFIHTLAYVDDATAGKTRPQLIASLKARLGVRQIINRVPEYPGSLDDVDGALDVQEKKLSRGDLLEIGLLLNAFDDSTVRAQIMRQGLDDLADTTSEHGGLLALEDFEHPRLRATLYPSLFSVNNFEYISGEKLLLETANGLAQYHFHFQQMYNEARAGPGVGDLLYARNMRCNCVVITSISPGKMDIDYYTPAGAVVDLGVYDGGHS